MKRYEMLERIRAALDKDDQDTNKHALKFKSILDETGTDLKKRDSSPSSTPKELSTKFIKEAKKNGTIIIEVEHRKNIPSSVQRELSKIISFPRLIRCFHEDLIKLSWSTAGLNVVDGTLSTEDKVGMSFAFAGISETGTLMLMSSPSNPTALAFLPEIHIVVLSETRIFCSLEDTLEDLVKREDKKAFPHSINLISGPSKTGDIGGHIVQGAHGPTQFMVILIKNE